MIITGALILSGPYAPDPTYRNLYFYDTVTTETNPNRIPRAFFLDLRNENGSAIPGLYYSLILPTGSAICPIGESDTGFTVELPTDEGFPEKPLYLIVTDSTTATPVFRYAFIEGYQRTGSQKIRCSCRFDQWTEHYYEIMHAEMTFARRHQKRYVDRTATPRSRNFNGLSDPVPEGMVQGTVKTSPALIYGAKTLSDVPGSNGHVAIPIWLYWRLATSDFYRKDTYEGAWGDPRRLLGVDTPKFAVPVLATCLGIIDYDPSTDLSAFRPLWRVYKSGGNVLMKCGDAGGGTETEAAAMTRAIVTLGTGHPYIAQSWITTIPPFPVTVDFAYDEDGFTRTIRRPTIKIGDSRYDNVMTPGDGHYYKIGQTSDEVPASLVVENGTFINLPIDTSTPFPVGSRLTYTLFDRSQSGEFSDAYEPKIEEAPYEGQKLLIYGAEIDISPTPANPSLSLKLTTGAHGDLVILSGSTEVYRSAGVCSQFGVDAATSSLTAWLVSNYQTYQNAKLWKTINTAVGAGTSIIAGTITGNVQSVLSGGIKAATGYGETFTGERARFADLMASPNATTLASENAFDNFPFVDLPRIKKRTIPSAIKTAIMNYWHVYGYPDNKIGTIAADATLRESFSYVQGALVNTVPGLYPSQVSEVVSAIRSGAWLWIARLEESPKKAKAVSEWVYVDRQTPLLSIDNREVT